MSTDQWRSFHVQLSRPRTTRFRSLDPTLARHATSRTVVDHHLATNLVELSDTGGLTFNLGSQNVQLRGGSFAGAPGQSFAGRFVRLLIACLLILLFQRRCLRLGKAESASVSLAGKLWDVSGVQSAVTSLYIIASSQARPQGMEKRHTHTHHKERNKKKQTLCHYVKHK